MSDSAGERPRRSVRVATWTAICGIPILVAAEILDSTEYFTVARDLLGLLGPDKVELAPDQLGRITEHLDQSAAAALSELTAEVAVLRAELRADAGTILAAGQSTAPDPGPRADTNGSRLESAAAPPAFEPLAWVQPGEGGDGIARAILAAGAPCPQITVDREPYPMIARRTFAEARFPVQVCEFRLRTGERASIAGLDLPVPTLEVESILLIGDTGCRLTHFRWQGCLDRDQWPFRRLLTEAVQHPVDLAIHIGDYHYREQACAGGRANCAGSPWGDTWEAWRADFFEPARQALRHAPWIMVRGNHEKCERAGAGWHHFLSPTMSDRTSQDQCREFTEPYQAILANGPRLVVVDAAYDDGVLYGDSGRAAYRHWQERVADLIGAPGADLWLLVHQPLRSLPYAKPSPPCDAGRGACPLEAIRAELTKRQEKRSGASPDDVVIAGDTHMFQHVAGAGPFVQLIAGMGGTALDPTNDFVGFDSGARLTSRTDEAVHYTALARYGFALLNKIDGRWLAEVRAIDDDERITRMLTCALGDVETFGVRGCEIDGEAWPGTVAKHAQR